LLRWITVADIQGRGVIEDLLSDDPVTIGRYRLLGRLGGGGMGVVYLAASPAMRLVAVKVLQPGSADEPEFRAQFTREVAAAGRVSGMFTALVVDADANAARPWLATAYVAGPSLAEAVESQGPLPPESVLVLAAGLAEGLQAIHAAGVVHHDLKPSNVLLAEDGPRVIDFGISWGLEAAMTTPTETAIGMPGYFSPEQAKGLAVGPPSDIFSLGCVLTFAATGEGPFGAGPTPAVLYRVVHAEPNLSQVPDLLRPLIERCLAKDPAARPTLDELLAQLDELHTRVGVLTAAWLPEPFTRMIRRYVEYVFRARDHPRVPTRAAASPPPRPLLDDDVRFTAYWPEILSPGRWALLLVFAHKTSLVEEPGRAPVDPQKQVEALARAHFDDALPHPVSVDARYGLTRGARLRIVPDLPGVLCNPKDSEVEWWEPVHEIPFRILAGPELAGAVVRGTVRVWCGPLILGEVSIAMHVAVDGQDVQAPPVEKSFRRYRKIFPSYSHADHAIVADFAEVYRAVGDQYLQDIFALRSGERWNPRLMELIEAADVFQLFWSHNSMRSPHCRDEWEHALALQREGFVRPVYWEDPLPKDLGHGLPPAALRALHFVKVPVVEPSPQDSVSAHPSVPAQEQAQREVQEDVRTSPATLTPVSSVAGQPRAELAAPGSGTGDGRERALGGAVPRRRTRRLWVGWFAAATTATAAAALAAAVATTSSPGSHGHAPTPPAATRTVVPTSRPTNGVTATARFTGLHDGSKVSFIQNVTGHVADIPPGMDSWLVLQPVAALTYWPQRGPLHLDEHGHFDAVAIFGHSPTQDRGEHFILMIVVVPPDVSRRFEDFTSRPSGAGLSALPGGTQILTHITVERS
jgi:hypothetical protein